MLVTNQKRPGLFLYTFKQVCRTTFKTLGGKLQNLLGIKLTNDETLMFLSAVSNDIFAYFLFTGVDYESNSIKEYLLY